MSNLNTNPLDDVVDSPIRNLPGRIGEALKDAKFQHRHSTDIAAVTGGTGGGGAPIERGGPPDGTDIPNSTVGWTFPAGVDRVAYFTVTREGNADVTVNLPSGRSVTLDRNSVRTWPDAAGVDFIDTAGITIDTAGNSNADISWVVY